MVKQWEKNGKRRLYLVAALGLILILSGGAFAYTYTTAVGTINVGAPSSDVATSNVSSSQPNWSSVTANLSENTTCGEVPTGDLFNIIPNAAYTGDLVTNVYMANTAELTKAYSYLNIKLYLEGSAEADQTPNYRLLTLKNGDTAFNLEEIQSTSSTWNQTSQADFEGGTLFQVDAISPGDVILDTVTDDVTQTSQADFETGTLYQVDTTTSAGDVILDTFADNVTQTSQADFETGTLYQVDTTTSPGDVLLDTLTDNVTDTFDDETKIAASTNVTVTGGQVKLTTTGGPGTETLRPNGAGTTTQLTPVGDTPNWECVDEETADDDTTYVKNTEATWKTDTYAMQNHSVGSGDIEQVIVYVRAKDPQYARPDSDISTGSWTTAPLWQKIDEVTPNDADYIQTAATASSTAKVGLSNVTDPQSSSGHIVRFRARQYNFGYNNMTVALYQGDTLIRSYTTPALTTSWTAYSFTLTAAEADSITDYTDLRLWFTAATISSVIPIQVSWAELEVPAVVKGAKTVIRTHDTDYEGDLEAPGESYAYYSTTYTENPSTSASWTWDEVDALEAGVSLAGDESRCTQVYVEVDYTGVSSETETLRPNAAGDEANIASQSPSSGAHWDKVDEAASDNLSTYVYTSATDYERDLYNVPDHSEGSGTISAITVYARCYWSGSASPNQASIKIAIKSGTGTGAPDTVDEGDAETLAALQVWENFSGEWTTNPATSSAWTWDEIDKLQIGIALRESFVGGPANTCCTQLYVEVEYVVSAGGYASPGTLTSTNLLSGETVDSIDSFYYNASAIPSGTGLKVQFSTDNTTWYNSANTSGGWDTLSQGTDTIDLSGLGWSGANFYYKMEFTSDGSDTPVLDEIRVNFSSYYTSGTLTSINLLSGEAVISIDSFYYNASAIPSGTGLKVQFSTDNTTWYNSSGNASDWDTLSQGTDTIDLSGLGWSGANFYYKMGFTSDGADTPVLDEIRVNFSTYYASGTLTSINLLSGETVDSIDSFYYNASAIPSGTGLKVQFSTDNTTWYNSANTSGGWDTLSQGTDTIDLSGLGWSGANFYYKMEFTSDGSDTPVLDEIRVNFSSSSYYTSGTLTSSAYDTGYDADWDWQYIYFTIDEPSTTDIVFQIRTASTEGGLNLAAWYGPTGTGDNYSTSGTAINSVHDGDRWIQYKAYFSGPGTSTPTLSDVAITYTTETVSFTIEVIGGSYCLVSDNTSEWGEGWTVTPKFYCKATQR